MKKIEIANNITINLTFDQLKGIVGTYQSSLYELISEGFYLYIQLKMS